MVENFDEWIGTEVILHYQDYNQMTQGMDCFWPCFIFLVQYC